MLGTSGKRPFMCALDVQLTHRANGTILLSIFAAIMSSASRRRALQRTVAGPLVTQVRDVLRAPFSTGFKRLNVTMARTGLVLMFACAAPSSAVLFVVNSLPERYTNENWNRLTGELARTADRPEFQLIRSSMVIPLGFDTSPSCHLPR
jgi:hypothetical protein